MFNLSNFVINNTGIIKIVDLPNLSELRNRGICNPSIIKHNGKILLSLRSVDYTYIVYAYDSFSINKNYYYPYYTDHNPTCNHSRNVIAELNTSDLTISNEKLFLTELGGTLQWNGYEDIRLNSCDGKLYTSASYIKDYDTIVIRQSLLDENYNEVSYSDYGINNVEKNWMPVIGDSNKFMYAAPGNMVSIEKGKVVMVKRGDSKYRGSTQLIPYKDGYICIIHGTEHINQLNGMVLYQYKHKFLYYDSKFNLIKESDWFTFLGFVVEFTCGMYIEDNMVIIPFSTYDSCAFILKFDISLIDKILSNNLTTSGKLHDLDNLNYIIFNSTYANTAFQTAQYLVSIDQTPIPAKISLYTYLADVAGDKELKKESYLQAIYLLKKFNTAQKNIYSHQLIQQDLLIEQLKRMQ